MPLAMHIVLWTLGAVAVLLFLVYLIGGYFMYRVAIRRDDKRQNKCWELPMSKRDSESDEDFARMKEGEAFVKGRLAEFVTITARDGLKLTARVFEHPEARGMFVMVHGYRSSSLGDFSGAVKPVYDMGYSLFLIDQRGHGRSEGKNVCFGAFERYDVVDWANYIKQRWPGLPVVMDGVSMGSGTVMLGCGVGYPDNVKAIIADCGYTTPGAICRSVLHKHMHLPTFPIYYGGRLWTKLLAKYDLDKISATDALKKLSDKSLYPHPIPILIAHGHKDGFVPYAMSEENIKSLEDKDGNLLPFAEFFTSEEADHGMSFLKDYDGYMAAIGRLFDKAGLPHDKVEEPAFVPETPVSELTRDNADTGMIYTIN